MRALGGRGTWRLDLVLCERLTLGCRRARLQASTKEAARPQTSKKSSLTLTTKQNRFDTFLNLRVADIQAVYDEWRGRRAEFLTPLLDNQGYDLRCYLRDPDGRIMEVGQATGFLEDLED
jgi:hypothetical protein